LTLKSKLFLGVIIVGGGEIPPGAKLQFSVVAFKTMFYTRAGIKITCQDYKTISFKKINIILLIWKSIGVKIR